MMRQQRHKSKSKSSNSTTEQTNSCPECHGQVINEGQGERICTDCGLVITHEAIDHGPEWRAYSAKQSQEKSRVGPPRTVQRHDHGLGSNIGGSLTESFQMRRMRRLNNQYESKKARNKAHLLREIKRLVDSLGLSGTIADRASKIGTQAHEANLAVGRSLEAVATAATIAAFRETRFPIPLSELKTHVSDSQHICLSVLQEIYSLTDISPQILTPSEHVPRLVSALKLPQSIEQAAISLCDRAEANQLHIGRNPASIASAALYAVTRHLKDPPTQKTIADAADLSPSTLRDNHQFLKTELDSINPQAEQFVCD